MFLTPGQLKDPKDEFVLEAAGNGRAEALVTHNILLDLMDLQGPVPFQTSSRRLSDQAVADAPAGQ